jgi:actin-like ATPase involved in cell morphogenesis
VSFEENMALVEKAILKAQYANVDTILFFGGLSEYAESEGFDRPNLSLPYNQAKLLEVKGRDISSGMPKTVTLSSKEMIGAMYEPMTALIDGICDVIERTPPELVGDILHNGIILVGGGAKLKGLHKLIARVTGIKTVIAENPDSCAVLGMGKKMETLNKFSFDDDGGAIYRR